MNNRPNSRQSRAANLRVSDYVDTRKYWTKTQSKSNKIQLLINSFKAKAKAKSEGLSDQPYRGSNNRKFTRGRAKVVRDIKGIQSVPVFDEDSHNKVLLGFKIIEHKRL